MAPIHFKINDNGKIINVSYDEDIIAEVFMLDFVKMHSGISSIDHDVFVFKIGCKILNSPRFRKVKIKEIIQNGQMIYFVRKRNISYGPHPLDFTEKTKKKVGKTKNEPDYEITHKGINIYGICKSQKCDACQKIVISEYDQEHLEFYFELFNIICPLCKGIIEPKAIGFYMCLYRISGKKLENGKIINFDNGYKETNDPEYCDYFDNGRLSDSFFKYTELFFEASKIN